MAARAAVAVAVSNPSKPLPASQDILYGRPGACPRTFTRHARRGGTASQRGGAGQCQRHQRSREVPCGGGGATRSSGSCAGAPGSTINKFVKSIRAILFLPSMCNALSGGRVGAAGWHATYLEGKSAGAEALTRCAGRRRNCNQSFSQLLCISYASCCPTDCRSSRHERHEPGPRARKELRLCFSRRAARAARRGNAQQPAAHQGAVAQGARSGGGAAPRGRSRADSGGFIRDRTRRGSRLSAHTPPLPAAVAG